MAKLTKLPLVELDIRETRVSATVVREFQESHPDCNILY